MGIKTNIILTAVTLATIVGSCFNQNEGITPIHIKKTRTSGWIWLALKITVPKGTTFNGIMISLGGRNEGTRLPYLDVIDFGPGVKASSTQEIFEPFHTTSTEGTGLGLYIARELCECNNARLSYIDITTAGGCFRISFSNPNRLKI